MKPTSRPAFVHHLSSKKPSTRQQMAATRGAAPTLAYTLLVLESPLVARKHRIDVSATAFKAVRV